jgi:hypothetical protein
LNYVKNLSLINISPNKIANLIKSNIASDYQRYGRDNITHLGFKIDEMLLTCSFNNIPCNISQDFVWVYSYDFVNCYTFNSGQDQNGNIVPLKNVNNNELDNSLQLEIFIGDDKIQSEFILNSGVKILVNSHNLERIIAGEGTNISPGFNTNFILNSLVNITRLDSPYNDCIKNVQSASSYNSYYYKAIFTVLNQTIYKQRLCFQLYLQDYIKNACGCLCGSLPNIYSYDNITICKSLDLLGCAENARIDYYNNKLRKKFDECPKECDSMFYNVDVSFASRFSSYYNQYFWEALNLLNYSSLNNSDLSKNVVRLNIFYDALKEISLYQKPSLTSESLLSTVGGIVSLFLGMTLIEIPKIIEFFIHNFILLVQFNHPKKINFI